jgi:RNA-directed DNA polymerase
MVKGTSSKDDPALREYWLKREFRGLSDLTSNKRMLMAKQRCLCPQCGQSLLNGEQVYEVHPIEDKNNPQPELIENRQLVHFYCHQQLLKMASKKRPVKQEDLQCD